MPGSISIYLFIKYQVTFRYSFLIAAATSKWFNLRSLRNDLTIQKSIAALLMCVLMISTAPKNWFHDALAHHKDVVAVCQHPDPRTPCLHQSTINCHFDLLVVTSLYEFRAEKFTLALPVQPVQFICGSVPVCYPLLPGSPESRGPPPACC